MASEELCWMPASEMAGLIRRKKLSPVEAIDAVLDRIAKVDPKLNAFVTLTAEQARREAKAAERALTRKGATLGPLHGVPFSVKDLVTTKGVRTTFGTPLFRDNVPTEDAPMVERLRAAGAIMLGKTNTPTFGCIPIYPVSGAWSLSHVGPLTRTVTDAALMLNASAGPDERDQYSLPAERVDYVKALAGGIKGLRVAYADDLGFVEAVEPEVRAACVTDSKA